MKLVYAHNGQAPAAGKREVWIDANGDWFLLTGSALAPDGTVKTTMRALIPAPTTPPPIDLPPVPGVAVLHAEVP